jgi:hypothetical protein
LREPSTLERQRLTLQLLRRRRPEFLYAAIGIANDWMFITRMPSNATPRSKSRAS